MAMRVLNADLLGAVCAQLSNTSDEGVVSDDVRALLRFAAACRASRDAVAAHTRGFDFDAVHRRLLQRERAETRIDTPLALCRDLLGLSKPEYLRVRLRFDAGGTARGAGFSGTPRERWWPTAAKTVSSAQLARLALVTLPLAARLFGWGALATRLDAVCARVAGARDRLAREHPDLGADVLEAGTALLSSPGHANFCREMAACFANDKQLIIYKLLI